MLIDFASKSIYNNVQNQYMKMMISKTFNTNKQPKNYSKNTLLKT